MPKQKNKTAYKTLASDSWVERKLGTWQKPYEIIPDLFRSSKGFRQTHTSKTSRRSFKVGRKNP